MQSCNEYSCSISLLLLLFGVYCLKSTVLLQPLGHCLLFMIIIVLIDYEGIIGEYCCRDRCQQAAHFHNITPTLPGHFFYAAWTSSSSSNCCCHLLLVNLLLLAGAIFISDDLVKSKLTYYRAMGNGHSWKLATVELWMFVRFRFHQSFSCVEKQSLDPFGLRNQQTCPY